MESAPMVCYSMGAINFLVEKIMPLIVENRPMTELLQDLKSLREDVLIKFAGGWVAGEQVIKVWMKQVREMVYDIEDWIDLKLEAANFSESDKKQIDRFKGLIQQARHRCERYELLKKAPTSDAVPVYAGPSEVAGPRLLWEEKTALVGIDDSKSELLNHLENKQKKLKVISILGAAGHGKTALAKEIYRDMYIKRQFECQAFVSVGRTTSTRTALIEILHQVKSEADARQSRRCNEEEEISEIVTEIWRFLRNKRYFICIDDIRSTQDSEAINCALPYNNLGSRILTTTRMKDIASRRPNDVVYEMISLNETDSKTLFRSSVYVQEEEWPDHFKESLNKMVQVCDGVPLAIIITAGLLGRTSAELSLQSKKLNGTILSESDKLYSASQEMVRKMLDISYGDLPLPVKSCFLYLTAFSGNHVIAKDRLIRRWVAEGFIPEKPGKSSLETGEGYFDELISRRLIQPAFADNDDQPIGCTVHGFVADFIESLSTKENFITSGLELKSGMFPYDRVRRVSLDYGDEDEGDTLFSSTYCLLEQKSWAASCSNENSSSDEAISLHLSRVRSLAFSGNAKKIPNLLAFKHVRVLDLEDTKGLENNNLDSIGRLSLLRYLGISGADVNRLPTEIMELQQLTILNLRKTGVKRLPRFGDTKLLSLLADQLIISRIMGGMPKLEELSEVLLGPDGSLADDLARFVNELGRLRILGVKFSRRLNGENEIERRGVNHFLEEVMKKSNLQSLLLDNYLHQLLDLLVADHRWPRSLRKFELRIHECLPLVPPEIASLLSLTHLHISVETVEAQAVRALGHLPNLVLLKLHLSVNPRLTVGSEDGFQCLKVFWYDSLYCCGGTGVGLQFEAGAMPQLRRLRLDLDARETMANCDNLEFGIQHLVPYLVHVCATIHCKDNSTASEVEAHIKDQVSMNCNNPVLALSTRFQRPTARLAEGSVIAIHSLENWSNHIDPDRLVVVNFTASWCPASRRMAPVFADLAKNYPNVVFLNVDVEDGAVKNIATNLGVRGVPTFLFMKGGSIKDEVVGANEKELEAKLDEQVALMR
ncbi:unnamed protein product [Urochloa decumbens]|uniref:Thioredoxin domain-containing protein n=1 Tax=Urochloa decumbens TaxID=240449 RepID=A0ABC9B124_9POAL